MVSRSGQNLVFCCTAAVLFSACGTGAEPSEVRGIDLSPDGATLFVADSLQLAATGRDASGRAANGSEIVFTSSDTAKAKVTRTGLVYGISRGSVTISASTQGFSTQVLLNVRLGGTVGPAGGTASVPSVLSLRIPAGVLQQTTEIDFDSLPTAAAPSLVPGTAFAVGPSGVALGQAAQLTVHYDLAGITPAWEQSVGLYHETDSGWVAVNGSLADLAEKSVTAPISAPGSYSIFAPGPVGSVTVTPSTVTVVFGTTLPLGCQVRDSSGADLTNRPVAWSSADTTIIQVTQQGRVIPIGFGSTTVTASSGGVSGGSTVTAAFICQCFTTTSGATPGSSCTCAPPPEGVR